MEPDTPPADVASAAPTDQVVVKGYPHALAARFAAAQRERAELVRLRSMQALRDFAGTLAVAGVLAGLVYLGGTWAWHRDGDLVDLLWVVLFIMGASAAVVLVMALAELPGVFGLDPYGGYFEDGLALARSLQADLHPRAEVRLTFDFRPLDEGSASRTATSPHSGAQKAWFRLHRIRFRGVLADGTVIGIDVIEKAKTKAKSSLRNEVQYKMRLEGHGQARWAWGEAGRLGPWHVVPGQDALCVWRVGSASDTRLPDVAAALARRTPHEGGAMREVS